MTTSTLPRVLTIAGSDSGGGAGIQADLKTFTSIGTYGTSYRESTLAHLNSLAQQLDSVLADIGTDAIKTGMLFNAAMINVVVAKIQEFNLTKFVLDPVMIATSGDRLLAEDAVAAITDQLLPLALVVTPNIPEALVLCKALQKGYSGVIETLEDMHAAARVLHAAGVKNVLIKGGHLPLSQPPRVAEGVQSVMIAPNVKRDNGEHVKYCVDVLFTGDELIEFWKEYVPTKNTHGTGCTLSAAIAAHLASGKSVVQSVQEGLLFVTNAISTSLSIGAGHGPLNHVYSIVPTKPAMTKETFIQHLKDSCKTDWDEYINHEFVRGLADGSLNPESFKHYIRQDYIYLLHYARAYALAAFKSNRFEDIVAASGVALHIAQESQLHVKYCESWGISLEELERTKEATANLSYTRYFLEKGLSGDLLDLYIAMAPCLIGYGEIGLKLANDPNTKREGNLYWEWISNYGKEDFQSAVALGEDLLFRLYTEMVPSSNANRLQELCDVFRQATILEVKFWDS
ncbi:Phosphomethylpyrimidine kinase-domain-containing protein [Obelidium mucronatum]|nr:Phosphomethylpyrimidine kinase-domain-containing protein [Obelidium mucronatum]